jgi:hypothetical protein
MERAGRRTDRGERNHVAGVRNDAASRLRQDYSATSDRLAAAAPVVEAPVGQLVSEAAKVREGLMAERAAWEAERLALLAPRTPSSRQIEKALVADEVAARARARLRFQAVENRVARTRERRLQLAAWIRNPARMIWAKHAELNALARARAANRLSTRPPRPPVSGGRWCPRSSAWIAGSRAPHGPFRTWWWRRNWASAA